MVGVRFDLRPVDPPAWADHDLVVEVRGEVDSSNAIDFDRALTDLGGSRPLVLDLSMTSFFDSAGFAALDRVLDRGRTCIVISPTGLVRKAATILGVPFHDTIEDARRTLAARGRPGA
jgi:anti-sigma B factor antagonist